MTANEGKCSSKARTIHPTPELARALSIAANRHVEKALHELFVRRRLNGEWFALRPEDVIEARRYIAERTK